MWRAVMVLCLFLLPVAAGAGAGARIGSVMTCSSVFVLDGDTFDCDGARIRLRGIDAPEMPDHCAAGRRCVTGDAFAARDRLRSLMTDKVVCAVQDIDRYGRLVALCDAGGVDVSCAMIASGHAVPRYAPISCPQGSEMNDQR